MTLIEEDPVFQITDDKRLVQLHFEIAQRADQLVQHYVGPHDREMDLRCWSEAERQVLAHHDWR